MGFSVHIGDGICLDLCAMDVDGPACVYVGLAHGRMFAASVPKPWFCKLALEDGIQWSL